MNGVDQLLDAAKGHAPEILTATVGVLGIQSINEGSATYVELQEDQSLEAQRAIVRRASGRILTGTAALAAVALAAGNPNFAIPQTAATLANVRPYLGSRYPQIAAALEKIRADILTIIMTLSAGAYTAATHVHSTADALPVAGLTAISTAFAIGGGGSREKIYRLFTIGGGITMIAGSALSMVEADSNVGRIMSGIFLALNLQFSGNEIRSITKTPTKE